MINKKAEREEAKFNCWYINATVKEIENKVVELEGTLEHWVKMIQNTLSNRLAWERKSDWRSLKRNSEV